MIAGRRTDYVYPYSTDTAADGTPSRRRRKPPTRRPAVNPPRWDGAACQGWPTQLWFSDNTNDTQLAKSICGGCPHTGTTGACATFARDATNPHIHDGIWGGIDMSNTPNRAAPLMCAGPGCDKPATGRRKYCSDRCSRRTNWARWKVQKDSIDAPIDRCDCGQWRWDQRCPRCDQPAHDNA